MPRVMTRPSLGEQIRWETLIGDNNNSDSSNSISKSSNIVLLAIVMIIVEVTITMLVVNSCERNSNRSNDRGSVRVAIMIAE